MLFMKSLVLASFVLVMPLAGHAVQFLDQRDSAFYESGFLNSGEDSKLCGAVASLNWLLLFKPDFFSSKMSQVDFIRLNNNELLKADGTDVRNGLSDNELKKYLEIQSKRLQSPLSFEVIDLRQQSLASVQAYLSDSQQQILLIRFKQRASSGAPIFEGRGGRSPNFPSSPRVALPVEEALMQVQHFVLQVKWDAESGVLWVVDSENPYTYTKLRIQTSRSEIGPRTQVLGVEGNEFPRFRWGVPTDWHLLSLVRIKN